MPTQIRLIRPFLLIALLLSVVGCGITDYENKMVNAQARVNRWEEMSRLLDAPLTVPMKAENNGGYTPMVSLFLRPLKGIGSRPTNENEPRADMMYTYEQPHQQGFAFPLVEIAFAPAKTKDFESRVLSCYSTTQKPTRRTRQVKDPAREPLTFTTYEFDDNVYSYSINFFKGPQTQAAVVYRVLKSGKSQFVRAIELSLETFGLDADAGRVRNSQPGPPLVVAPHPN